MSDKEKSQLPPWLTETNLKATTGFSSHYFKVRRMPGHPEYMQLPFFKIGRAVRYKRSDVEAWMAKRETPEQLEA